MSVRNVLAKICLKKGHSILELDIVYSHILYLLQPKGPGVSLAVHFDAADYKRVFPLIAVAGRL